MEPTNPFIQTRGKNAVYVAKNRIGILTVELFSQEFDHSLKFLGSADLEDSISQHGCRWEGLKADSN